MIISFSFIWLVAAILLLAWLVKRLVSVESRVPNISNKYVLITGCGSGFGKLAAARLDGLGFHVFATCRTKAGEENVRQICSERVRTFCMDVTSSSDLERVYSLVKNAIPSDEGLWGLINNAGVLHIGPIDWQSLETFKHTADVNLWGMIAVTKTFLPLIKKTKGRVVNMSSSMSRMALPYMTSYCISKYGVDAFTDAFRREMKPWNVKVICIEAGGHKTKLVDGKLLAQQWRTLWDRLNEDVKEGYGSECADQGANEMLRFDSVMSPHVDGVVDAMVTSLTVTSPKCRYLVGLDAKAFIWLAFLPESFVDWLLTFIIKPLQPRSV